ncbi:MAG: hypothetical protein H7281_01665 [Bacteriovorax sp.]|nr:hypothetical protein [Bacteriovorax sp.]
MSTEQHHVSWESVKNKIMHKWKKFEDSDIESMKEDLGMLSEKLQSLYSYPKSKADQEMKEFRTTLEEKPKHH